MIMVYEKGELVESQTRVILGPLEKGRSKDEQLYALTHNNRYFLCGKYFDVGRNTIVYGEFDCFLDTRIQQLKLAGITPTMTFQVPSTNINYSYTPPEFRRIIRDMFAGLVQLHERDKRCISSLEMKNFVMHKGVVKMWQLRFIPESEIARANDFQKLAKLIKEDICGGQCPSVLMHFINAIVQPTSRIMEKTLVKHLAIAESSERLSFFKNCYDKVVALDDSQKSQYHNDIMAIMVCCKGWAKELSEDSSTEESERKYGILTEVFNHGDRKDTYVDRGSLASINYSFVRWIRNLATHLRPKISFFNQTAAKDDMVELSILALHEEPLLTFHDELCFSLLIHSFT